MQQPAEGDRAKRMAQVAIAMVVVGAILRLVEYLAVRSLWLDEAMLANNIVGRGFAALLGPLGESQNAPWFFLLGERAAAVTFGANELALRLIPFLAGIALPWVTWLTAKRLTHATTALIATAIAALSPLLLYYANEVKPYSTDALLTVALTLATLRALDRPNERAPWAVLVIAGAGALLASFPVMFVLASAWCAIAGSPVARASANGRRTLVVAPVAWGTTFAFPYFLVIRRASSDDFLMTSLRDQFLVPWSARGVASLWRLWQELSVEVFLGKEVLALVPFAVTAVLCTLILALCIAGGIAVMRRRGMSALILLVGPVAVALAASTVRAYPLSVRVWTYTAPLWVILVAAGIVDVARRLRPAARPQAAAFATVCLMLTACVDAASGLTSPYRQRSHIRPMIRTLQDVQRSTREAVYVMPRATSQWLFYTTEWNTDPAPVPRDSATRWIEQRTCAPQSGNSRAGCQMLGAHSSVTFAEVSGFAGKPDTAWADHEVERIQAAAHPCGWLLMHLPYPGEMPALARAVELRGGRVESTLSHPGRPTRDGATEAFHICFGERGSSPLPRSAQRPAPEARRAVATAP
ncbi:MAG TPA: glycosyltransferase family 39 protein [Gemmatimonadaceae bacterium]|nr:glycosyltransferase family 39 protein [Gemmatimonadaceae bacterium]